MHGACGMSKVYDYCPHIPLKIESIWPLSDASCGGNVFISASQLYIFHTVMESCFCICVQPCILWCRVCVYTICLHTCPNMCRAFLMVDSSIPQSNAVTAAKATPKSLRGEVRSVTICVQTERVTCSVFQANSDSRSQFTVDISPCFQWDFSYCGMNIGPFFDELMLSYWLTLLCYVL